MYTKCEVSVLVLHVKPNMYSKVSVLISVFKKIISVHQYWEDILSLIAL